jgi:hypothetical protein
MEDQAVDLTEDQTVDLMEDLTEDQMVDLMEDQAVAHTITSPKTKATAMAQAAPMVSQEATTVDATKM